MNINYHQFHEALKPFLCFSLKDARKHFPEFDRKRLTEWQRKGYVNKVVREHYFFADIRNDTRLWWYLANCVFEPSYISLQSALSHYEFIPEAVFNTTSITTKRTRSLDTGDKRFIYRNIKKSCYFGYTLIPFAEEHYIRFAEPEKALLDQLYLETSLKGSDDFEAWRFNKSLIREAINITVIEQYARLMENRSFYTRFLRFKKWLNA